MYNPQYTARFAVIMEAYLKACGESMLVRYSMHTSFVPNTVNVWNSFLEVLVVASLEVMCCPGVYILC